MGRATIVSGGTDGRYTVEIDTGAAQRDARVASLESKKSTVETQISDKEAERNDLSSFVISANNAVNAAIDAYNASEKTPEDMAALKSAVVAKNWATDQLARMGSVISVLKARLASINAAITRLNRLDLVTTKEVWCADFSEEATGEVATIEINGEAPKILLAPGGELSPEIPAPAAADGQLVARGIMSGPQAFFNAAILPGWQKYRPTYRIGTITFVDYEKDECTVELDEALSSAQDLDINQSTTLEEVPIEYLDCNAGVFEEDDKVVVQFEGQDWDNPKVIGFESEPRPCWGITINVWRKESPNYNYFYGTPKHDEEELRGYFEAAIADLPEAFNPITEIEIYVKRAGFAWEKLSHQHWLDASGAFGEDYKYHAITFSISHPGVDVYNCVLIRKQPNPLNGEVLWLDVEFQATAAGGANVAGVTEWFMRRTFDDREKIFHFAVDFSSRAANACAIKGAKGYFQATGSPTASPIIPFEIARIEEYELSDPPP